MVQNVHRILKLKVTDLREFPDGPVVKIQCFHCHGPGSIPSLGTKILQATHSVAKKRERERDLNEIFDMQAATTLVCPH